MELNDTLDSFKDTLRQQQMKLFWSNFGKCLGPAVIISMISTVISMLIIGGVDLLLKMFTPAEAAMTAGRFISAFLLFLILFVGIYLFSYRDNERKKFITKDYCMIACVMTLVYILTLVTVRYINVYVMPILLVMLLISELLNRQYAIYATMMTSLLLVMTYVVLPDVSISFTLPQIVAAVISNSVVAVITNFIVDRHLSRIQFLVNALLSSLFIVPFIIAFTVALGDLTVNIVINSALAYAGCAGAIFLFLPICAIIESIFNIADDFRLNELCNLNSPLLKRLASEAPGTFNHSLVVGNLAEACAEAIGENTQLARCGAYYHDIGKLKAPIYFSENQTDYNPHDELIPEVSVSMITSHTLFGEILAKQNKLPPEIVAICREHHGTSPVGYFYNKALNYTEEGDLTVDRFTYAGPKPQTKISAIIMISDTIEAAMRAYSPDSTEEYKERINKLIDEKLELGQFDECPITLSEIATIKKTIYRVLPSIQHKRVRYNEKKQ